MGRKVNQEVEENEEPKPAADATEPTLEGGALGVPDVQAAGTAPEKKFEAPVCKRYRIGGYQPARFNTPNGITYLHPGQIVDDLNYDIAALKALGIQLTEVEG